MDIKEDIKTLFREIEVYCSHSLFEEAKQKCQKLEALIQGSSRIKNKQELLEIVAQKVKNLEGDARRVEEKAASAEMSAREQNLVKKLFAFSRGKRDDSAAIEGATALMVFGQFEKALGELNELIKIDSLRVIAAKNTIRCHIGLSSLDDAVGQYKQWLSSGQFPAGELEHIRAFLQDILNKKGLDEILPVPEEKTEVKEDDLEGEYLDILTVQIPINDELQENKDVILDVGYQKGNMVSVIIPEGNHMLVDSLKAGLRIDEAQFYSPAVVFKSSCVISALNQIESGPQKGSYALIMQILDA